MLTRRSLQYAQDVNLLVNHGILANQLGHGEEAIQSWKQAIALDGSQVSAYLYAAGELDREGKSGGSPLCVMFLNKVAQAGQTVVPRRTIWWQSS
jgi:hypothetical protein